MSGVLSYFLIFHRLDVHAINSWDESLFASRAFQVAFHGELFTNWQQIDNCSLNHPNTKPPLVTFIQAGFFKAFGYSRLSLRFPIAFMGLLTAILLFRWFSKWFSQFHTGLLAVFILLSSAGYNQYHVLRTGDQDAALAFWFILSIFCVWAYHFAHKRKVYLILFFVFTSFAVLTKSALGLIMLPGIGIYVLFFTPVLQLLKRPILYIGILLAFGIVALFYGGMELNNPGFLELVWDNEVGGRYGKSIDSHVGPWSYYFEYLFETGFSGFLFLVLPGIWFGMKAKNKGLRHATILISICAITSSLVISLAKTKLLWYAAPLYPLLAFLAAIGLSGICKHWIIPFLHRLTLRKVHPSFLVVIFIAAISYPCYLIIDRNAREKTAYDIERYELVMDKIRIQFPEHKKLRIHTRGEYYPSLVFLQNKFEKVYGYELELIGAKDEFVTGDLVLSSYHNRMKEVPRKTLLVYDKIYFWQIL